VKLTFRLLGRVEAMAGQEPIGLGGPRSQAVLAALLLEPNRVVVLDRLVEAAWGDHAPAGARVQAQNRISGLRRAIEEATGEQPISSAGGGYLIRLSPAQCDLEEFEARLQTAQAHRADGALEKAAQEFSAALALWRGPALAGLETPRLTATARRLGEARLNASEQLMEVELLRGRHQEIVGALVELTAANPWREKFSAQLMTALYRSGRQPDALRHFEQTRQRLASELGLDPGRELTEVRDLILRDELSAPPATAAAPAISMLPHAAQGFVGRESEQDLLSGWARGAGSAMVTALITGTAGVGKTALAVTWGHRFSEHFPDGQLYVNLRGHGPGEPLRPAAAIVSLLEILGAAPAQIPLDTNAAASVYRSALHGKRMLVLLDNAASADQVRPLLPGGKGSLVIVTSRETLTGLTAIDGARRISLNRLSGPDSLELMGQMLGQRRVTREPEAAAELAAACAHLPLALRIATAQLAEQPDLGIASHVGELRHQSKVDALSIPADDDAAVRVAFDRSYRLLAPPAARLFRLLGLSPAPDLSAEAAAHLADISPWHSAELLEQLASAHLAERPGPGRYALHDLLRDYARSLPAEPDALPRLYSYYLSTANNAARAAFPLALRLPDAAEGDETAFHDRAAAISWLDAERSVLTSLASQATALGVPEMAWLLSDTLRHYLWVRRSTSQWQAIETAAFEAASARGHIAACAAAKFGLGMACTNHSRYADAISHYEEGLTYARKAGWLAAQASLASGLGVACSELGRLSEAAGHLRTALAINEELGRKGNQANNLGNLGLLLIRMGSFTEAIQALSSSLDIHRANGGSPYDSVYLHGLGQARRLAGEPSLEPLLESVTLCRELDEPEQECLGLAELAETHAALGDAAQAAVHASRAVEVSRHSDDHDIKSVALSSRCAIRAAAGDLAGAVSDGRQARQHALDSGNSYVLTLALVELATAYARSGDPGNARPLAREAHSVATASGFRHLATRAAAIPSTAR
jgi:DNA-binding SARP family transcriptional activator